jgi:hypothetical protein
VYYGGPFVTFGFDDFVFAHRFPHRRFFDDRFRRFDGRFTNNRGFFPGRFAMQPGMGRAFAVNGGFHGGFAHGGRNVEALNASHPAPVRERGKGLVCAVPHRTAGRSLPLAVAPA